MYAVLKDILFPKDILSQNKNHVVSERRMTAREVSMDWYKKGYDTGRTIAGTPGHHATLCAAGLNGNEIRDWLDGLLICMEGRRGQVNGIRTSIDISTALRRGPDYDEVNETYKGTKVAYATSFFPDGRVEVSIGSASTGTPKPGRRGGAG